MTLRRRAALVVILALLVVLALAAVLVLAIIPGAPSPPATPGTVFTPAPRSKTTDCVAHSGLPDPACTPGALNPTVTQATIGQTICVAGYTRTVRPPSQVTDPIKRRQIRAYGAYAGTALRGYELDHLISLELGGAPADEANLWPEARGGSLGAEAKDAVENYLHREVCTGRLPLAEAQRQIAADWTAIYARLPDTARRAVGEGASEGQ